MPNVSIIMPVYNKEKYLDDSISSVLNQKYQDFELIVVNDGSEDRSLNIIEKYAKSDHRIKVYSIPNGGVSNARNYGLSKASGQWIQFLDGDDRLDEDYLLCAMPVAEENDVDILFSNFKMINTNCECLKEVLCSYQGDADKIQLGNLFIEYQYKNGFFGFISNKLIRRQLIFEVKAEFKKELKLAEDLDFFVQVYPYISNVYFMNICSFYYLQTETNYLNNLNIDYFQQLLIQLRIKGWIDALSDYVPSDLINVQICNYVCYIVFSSVENNTMNDDYYSFFENDILIQECLRIKYVKGIYRGIAILLKIKKYEWIENLLRFRFYIRTVYRRVKVWGK